MAKYTGNTLTNLGKDLLARAVIGEEALTFTKVELGKGVPGGDYEELTGLIEPFKVLAITSTAKLMGGSYRVRTAFSNSGITEDTYLREIGVFARGEDGIEILYSYCHTDTPDLIPAEGAGVLERVEDVITYISNAANVNAVIDQSKVYATMKDLTEGLAGKEDKFSKNSGFNLDKTDSAEIDSSILVATAKAVKKAWDKAKEAIGFTDTNRAAILNNTERIESLYKSYIWKEESSKDLVDTIEWTTLLNISSSALQQGTFITIDTSLPANLYWTTHTWPLFRLLHGDSVQVSDAHNWPDAEYIGIRIDSYGNLQYKRVKGTSIHDNNIGAIYIL